MNNNHKELISMLLTITIVAVTIFIIHRFIPSIVWAAIIVIASYPLYQRWLRLFGGWHNLAAFLFTFMLAVLLLLPLSGLVTVLVQETQLFINYLQHINRNGGQAPAVIRDLPFVGNELVAYWDANIGQPGKVRHLLSNMHLSLAPLSYYVQQVSVNLAHRSFQFGFTLLTLFFFYRDGERLSQQISAIGSLCLGKRWFRYANRLPSALRATVNGQIIVGVGVGVLMGICYELTHFPAPTLTAFITALASMIPFAVPLVISVVALILFAQGSLMGALIVIAWGTAVMFVADHFVKPVMIGGAIKLPFLAVLFGILGGVETLGLLGLFIGPVIMVLFITLWQEPDALLQSTSEGR